MVFWSQRRSIPNSPARTSLYNYTSVFGVHRKGVVGRNRGGNIPKEPIVAHSAANPPHSSGQWMPTAISRSVLRMRSFLSLPRSFSLSVCSFYLYAPLAKVYGIRAYIGAHIHMYISIYIPTPGVPRHLRLPSLALSLRSSFSCISSIS